MRIMIVDDEADSLKVLGLMVRSLGYDPVLAASPIRALQIYEDDPVPMILSDWMMPEMTGPEFCREIRERQGDYYTYFILVTSRSDLQSMVEGLEAGADDFVAKPARRAELQARIRAGERVVILEKKLADRLAELQEAYTRIKRDLDAAASIQRALLPRKHVAIPGCEIAWKLRPCEELAGDVLNYFPIGGHLLAFYVVDVSGHGVHAALWAVTLSKELASTPGHSMLLGADEDCVTGVVLTPSAVLSRLNREYRVSDETNSQYFTIVFCFLDLRSGALHYCSAGHPPPILIRQDNTVETLSHVDGAIGLEEDSAFHTHTVQLNRGDRILLYSDGITEASNPEDKMFGSDTLLELVRNTAAESPADAVDQIMNAACKWCEPGQPADDMSLLSLEWSG